MGENLDSIGKYANLRAVQSKPLVVDESIQDCFMESDRIYASAIIVSDYSEQYSHWNAAESLGDWLKR